MKQPKIDDNKVNDAIKESETKVQKIREYLGKVQNTIFDNTLARFDKSAKLTPIKIVGQLVFEDLQSSPKFEDYHGIDLVNFISDISKLSHLWVDYLSNERYLIGVAYSSSLSVYIILNDGSLDYFSPKFITFKELDKICSNDTYSFIRFYSDVYKIKCIDHDLKCISEKNERSLFEGYTISMMTDKSPNVYFLVKQSSQLHIKVFDANLDKCLFDISLVTPDINSGFLSDHNYAIENDRLYCYIGNKVITFDVMSGSFLDQFEIPKSKSFAVIDTDVYLLDKNNQEVTVYRENGFIKGRTILNFSSTVDTIYHRNETIFFLDINNFTLFIPKVNLSETVSTIESV